MHASLRNGPGTKPRPKENLSPFPLSAEQVFQDYAPRVYHTARRMLRSDVDAEDVTQDVLLQVVRKLRSFRGESAFPTWLHRVTVNTALSHRRKRAVREERRADGPPHAYLDDSAPESPGRGWTLGPDARPWPANSGGASNAPSPPCRRFIARCSSWPTWRAARTSTSPRRWV